MRALISLSRFFLEHPLTQQAPLAAWQRFLSWQIRSRIKGEVVVPWVAGQRLVARRGMTGATGNIYAGLHEFADMMLMLHFLRAGELFLDVGANIGSYTILASGVRRARTWAFEPDPDTARALRRNLDENHLHDLVTVHQVALGEAEGEVSFTVGRDTVNRIAGPGDESVRQVRQKRLDDLVGEHRPTMIKMDIEGHESVALRGAVGALKLDSLKVIELESVDEGAHAMLRRVGFERAHYQPFTRRLSTEPTGLPIANALYVRDRDAVARRLAQAPCVVAARRARVF